MLGGRISSRRGRTRTSRGQYVIEMQIEQSRPGSDSQGERGRTVLSVELWGEQAERLDRSLGVGCAVYVEGWLASRSYEDHNRVRRHMMVVRTNRCELLGT